MTDEIEKQFDALRQQSGLGSRRTAALTSADHGTSQALRQARSQFGAGQGPSSLLLARSAGARHPALPHTSRGGERDDSMSALFGLLSRR